MKSVARLQKAGISTAGGAMNHETTEGARRKVADVVSAFGRLTTEKQLVVFSALTKLADQEPDAAGGETIEALTKGIDILAAEVCRVK